MKQLLERRARERYIQKERNELQKQLKVRENDRWTRVLATIISRCTTANGQDICFHALTLVVFLIRRHKTTVAEINQEMDMTLGLFPP